MAEKSGRRVLISLKWQQVGGTAEQKVPFEVICLLEAIRANKDRYDKAYIVLGGAGWTLRDFYVKRGLEQHFKHNDEVEILTLEQFVAKANGGKL